MIRDAVLEDLSKALEPHIAKLELLRRSHLLVTGGTGFVGSWLAEAVALLNDRHGFGIRLTLQSPTALRFLSKHPELGRREDLTLQEIDVRNLWELPRNADWVIHAAASPDGRLHASDPTKTIETIVRGTSAVLEAAMRSSSVRRILNLSSGLIYGPQPIDLPRLSESYVGSLNPASFTSAYAEAKRVAETLCASYSAQYRLPFTTARMFAFVGPYQLLDRPWAVNNFVRDATLGTNIRIHGNGHTIRSYMHPADMAVWLLAMLVKGQDGAAYNVGHPDEITLMALAEKIAARSRKPVRIETDVLPEHRSNTSRFVPDVSKAQRDLNLKCLFGLDHALDRMMAWAADSPSATLQIGV